jgi:glycosyltransferase involved in cell wall biosynthesis/predicted metal-dependent phosphoesterase TrpH
LAEADPEMLGDRSALGAAAARADLHCHSSASQLSKLGVQRSLGLPECATSPIEVYELAKLRGMDFVTITDHDTIEGVLELAERPDVFISEELTAWFRDEPRAVHVLCWGITPEDHERLQQLSADVERCAAYLREHDIVCALAHPFYAVEAPLLARHRKRLAELFPIWETRNGSRARDLNHPAAVYIDTLGGVGTGGSDDHAGVDIGRTFTETPAANTPYEFLEHVRAGSALARGEHGSAAKWAHAAIAIAARSVGHEPGPAPGAGTTLDLIERVMREGDLRSSDDASDLGPDDARGLLAAWLEAVGAGPAAPPLLRQLQARDSSHDELFRRARRAHERKLRTAVEHAVAGGAEPDRISTAGAALFGACTPVVPYIPAAAFIARERRKLVRSEGDRPRVALLADGIGANHGVTTTIQQIRDRGVPGFDVEIVGTDPNVDRRLPAAAEVAIPYYDELRVGVPSLWSVTETLIDGSYDIVHVAAPGPAGIAGAIVTRVMGLPMVASHHTDLPAYAGVRSNDARLESLLRKALSAFYANAALVLSPSSSADRSLEALGVPREHLRRWVRGVDLMRFRPRRAPETLPGRGLTVLYAGRLTEEKGMTLLAEAFLAARRTDPRLHLVLAGGGSKEGWLRERLGPGATFLGWLDGDALGRAYAEADIFCFPSRTDTFGQVVLEAQASGVPVVAVGEGGPLDLVTDHVDGLLCAPRREALSHALLELAASPPLRRRLARAALRAVQGRSWDHAFGQLAHSYRSALEASRIGREQAA